MRVNFSTNNYQQSQNNKQKVAFEQLHKKLTRVALEKAAEKTDYPALSIEQAKLFWDSLLNRQKIERTNSIKTIVSLDHNDNVVAIIKSAEQKRGEKPLQIEASVFSRYGRNDFFEKLNQAHADIKAN